MTIPYADMELHPADPESRKPRTPKCPRCGDVAYRPDPVSARLERLRCGGCHRTLAYCVCTDISEDPA